MEFKHKTRKPNAIPGVVALGLGVSMLITLLGTAILAYLISSEKIGEGSLNPGSMVVLFLGTAAGSWLVMAQVKEKKWIALSAYALSYFLILLSMTALFFGGEYIGIGKSVIVILTGCASSFLPGIIGKRKGSGRHKIPSYR